MRVEEGTQAPDEFNNNKFTCNDMIKTNLEWITHTQYVEIIMEYMKLFSNMMTYLIKENIMRKNIR